MKGWVGVKGLVGKTGKTTSFYWFGPDHGWGTTSSSDLNDPSVKVFPTRKACEDAARSVYGRSWRKQLTAQRLADLPPGKGRA